VKGSQDREARGKRASRAKLETEALHSTILATDRLENQASGYEETVGGGAEHSKPAHYTITIKNTHVHVNIYIIANK